MASALLILLEPVALRPVAFSEEPGLRIPPGQIAGPRTPSSDGWRLFGWNPTTGHQRYDTRAISIGFSIGFVESSVWNAFQLEHRLR